MNRRHATAVAVGGVAGAALRWLIVEAAGDGTAWPWGVFVANLGGCALLGLLVARFRSFSDTTAFLGLTVGFCGALTTFSSFAVDTAVFLRDDEWGLFVGYLGASVAGGLAVFLATYGLGRRALGEVIR